MSATQQVRRPLVGIALSLASGLYAHHLFGGAPLLFLGMGALVISWACWMHGHGRSTISFYLVCALLGAALHAVEKIEPPACSILPIAEVLFQEQEVVGTIDDSPAISSRDGTQSFRFRAEAVRLGTEWFRSDARFRVYIKRPQGEVAYGERWRLKGRYRSYEEAHAGIKGSLRVSDAARLQEAALSLKAFCYKTRQHASRILCVGMESFSEQTQLLRALLLGYREALSPAFYQRVAHTGTLHIFAISGLHVGVLASILVAALKMVGVPRTIWGVFLVPVLLFYVVSTGMKPSALRAFTMATVYFSAPLFGRRPDSVSAIALAAIILLAMDPLQITNPGFLLSFTVVSGIVMVHGYAMRRLTGFSRPSWAIPLAQLSGPRPLVALVRFFGLLALTSVAAWIFSAPLTARFFNTLSPVALAGNLAVIPLTFLIVLTGTLALVAAPVSLFVTLVFNHANRVFVGLLISVIRVMSTLPGAYVFIRSPPGSVLALWYAGLILFFTGTARMRKPAIFLLLGSLLFWFGGSFRPFSEMEVHKEGSATTLIRSESARWILVTDGSPYSMGQAARCLRREGVNRLHALVISDRRAEAEAVEQLSKIFLPKEVWMSPKAQGGVAAETLRRAGVPICFSSQPEWDVEGGVLSVSLD